ncbi:MAG: radical SAM protein [Bacteroidales bacterium]|jgi:wyosine [tRNA(Phe)-imidazoG37] synthetase (radical SAM superfamily)|nr:radical SAM protein [Bacteroidales bacterium]
MISFGPIPSRRLGMSLGINNIPSRKKCSYSCLYCQVGKTKSYSTELQKFYSPKVILQEVKARVDTLADSDKPDYLTFIANGEPTLDSSLGDSIDAVSEFGIPVAVVTNASLLSNKRVRENLMYADLVSVKVDAGLERVWWGIQQPSENLNFQSYLQGLFLFAQEFSGTLITETMLLAGINDSDDCVKETITVISQLNPSCSYISIPTRPTAFSEAQAPSEQIVTKVFQQFVNQGINTELLIGFEGTNAGSSGNAYEDILNMSAVHPIRDDTMEELLRKNEASYDIVDSMLYNNLLRKVHHDSHPFYIRQFHVK